MGTAMVRPSSRSTDRVSSVTNTLTTLDSASGGAAEDVPFIFQNLQILTDDALYVAQFFSFGTNDLTQTTFGISRDDAETGFLMEYLEKGILPENPFATIDERGVGKLMEMGVRLGRQTRPKLEIGICGEHGGDPRTIDFCHRIGMNYVSCSPFRVPIARLAAAHAALKEAEKEKA